jgi:FKBP-type peptidyl-prolyl cis-trans isomerase 2
MNPGDFVLINYIGRVKDTRELFDVTYEEVAKKENVFNPEVKYGPVPVIVDGGFLLKGLNDVIKEMKIGEKKKIELTSDKAFGERNAELVKLIPEARFKEQNIDVYPGSVVTVNNLHGKVLSVDGGRVKVDFNHHLAGKILEYEIEIVGEVKETVDKIKAVIFYFVGIEKDEIEIRLVEKEVEVQFKKKYDLHSQTKAVIARTITKWIAEIEAVKFVDVYKKD